MTEADRTCKPGSTSIRTTVSESIGQQGYYGTINVLSIHLIDSRYRTHTTFKNVIGIRLALRIINVCKNLFYLTTEIKILIEGEYVKFSFYLTKSELDRISELHFPDHPLLIIARGIASSPLWFMMPEAEIRVRLSPPEISILGLFDTADIARLKALAWQTKHALHTLRYIRYTDLEDDCHLLVSKLIERVDRDQLKNYYFTCIPRGGLVVLGLLSYILGLEQWQLEPPPARDAPVVVVDDCALTGKRFAQFLEKNRSDSIIFAPLYSSPELRSAIEAREHRVRACISAHDLESCLYAAEEDQRAFQKIFGEDLSPSDYWNGLTEYLCFAWNEPSFVFFNPVTKNVEGNWTIFPHEVCLKNGPVRIPVSVKQDTMMEFCVAGDVVTIHSDNSVMIENLVTHDRFIAKGIAAEMWNALMEYGTQEALLSKFLHEYAIDRITLKKDISDFIKNLISREILKTKKGEI